MACIGRHARTTSRAPRPNLAPAAGTHTELARPSTPVCHWRPLPATLPSGDPSNVWRREVRSGRGGQRPSNRAHSSATIKQSDNAISPNGIINQQLAILERHYLRYFEYAYRPGTRSRGQCLVSSDAAVSSLTVSLGAASICRTVPHSACTIRL